MEETKGRVIHTSDSSIFCFNSDLCDIRIPFLNHRFRRRVCIITISVLLDSIHKYFNSCVKFPWNEYDEYERYQSYIPALTINGTKARFRFIPKWSYFAYQLLQYSRDSIPGTDTVSFVEFRKILAKSKGLLNGLLFTMRISPVYKAIRTENYRFVLDQNGFPTFESESVTRFILDPGDLIVLFSLPGVDIMKLLNKIPGTRWLQGFKPFITWMAKSLPDVVTLSFCL